ncbi:hypothetical protein AMS68_008012 [Peltaster fructicola]|uniref:Uncharacterized protein n=1 Tax=Peltaster fructicola TaxID=286661 RepID=A0A6H0Y6G9_9PEZI|nr:hypothetical protein AMS68_008012 [Peltaster fructicola]
MAVKDLPDELVQILANEWPCREAQPSLLIPTTVVIEGPSATGKSGVVRAYLQAIDLPYTIVRCRECVTERHLLERTVRAVEDIVAKRTAADVSIDRNGKCESINALSTHLQDLMKPFDHFILVIDGVDKQREASSTLRPALARLGEIIPNLTTILIVQDSPPGAWRKPGIPHISFPAYTRDESITIVSSTPLDIFTRLDPGEYADELHDEDKAWLWPRFCAAVWDSMAQSAARDLTSFSDLCVKLWTPFVAPIVNGDLGTRDFSRLMVLQRKLFQDENALLDHIVDEDTLAVKTQLQLPYYAKWLLLAAFLASTNPTRMDALYFMKSTEKKRRKKGGIRPTGKAAQHKMPRHLMAPASFPLDRLLAILHAILPDDLRNSIDVYTQIATLTSLRLLARSSGLGQGDAIEAGSKWKIGPVVTWELISSLAGTLNFAIADYMVV